MRVRHWPAITVLTIAPESSAPLIIIADNLTEENLIGALPQRKGYLMSQSGDKAGSGLKYDFERAELLPFLPDSSHMLLDVGCGSGAFGRLLRSRRPDMELWAVEPDPASARAAEDGFDHVLVGKFPDDRLPQGRFDVVLCADVLEHMVSPETALCAAAGSLAQGGVMVASIPNVRHWRAVLWPLLRHGTWTYSERGILDRTHLRFFTRRSACDFFAANGWSVDSVSAINMIRRERLLSRLTGHLLDDFLVPQYVIVARPAPAEGAEG
jgi:SAM-dependent methyltransferase